MTRMQLVFGALLLILGLACSGRKTNGADASGANTVIQITANPGQGSSLGSGGTSALVSTGSTLTLQASLSLGSGFTYAVVPSSLGSITAEGVFTGATPGSGLIAVTWTKDTRYTSMFPVSVIALPTAQSLTTNAPNPGYNAAVPLVPVFSGGAGVIGSAGPGSSDIATAALSGSAWWTSKLTSPATFTLTVTNLAGGIVTTTCTVTPQTVSVVNVQPALPVATSGLIYAFGVTATGGATNSVVWSATGGTFTGTGWLAPATPGSYTITATSVDDPTKSASTTATVVAAPVSTSLSASSASPAYGSTFTLTPTYANGAGSLDNSLACPASGTPTGPISANWHGTKVYNLTVTNAGGIASTAACTVTPQTVSVTNLSPATPTVTVGLARTFTATGSGGATNSVTWSSSAGTWSANTWTAPASPQAVTITATSVDDPTKTASTTVTVVAAPVSTSLTTSSSSPAYGATFTLTPTYASGTGSIDNGVACPASGSASVAVTANWSGARVFTLTVTNAGGTMATSTCTVTPQAVSMTNVSPATPTVTVGLTRTFTATSSGGLTNGLTWSSSAGTWSANTWTAPASPQSVTITATSVDDPTKTATTTVTVVAAPVAASLVPSSANPPYNAPVTLTPTCSGGAATIGTSGSGSSDISGSALSGTGYATPNQTATHTYTLTVTNAAGSVATATCTVTPQSVLVSNLLPANATVAPGPQTFMATVTGGATNGVTWTASSGSFTGNVWTSPNTAGSATITATSVDNPAQSASTTITVSQPVLTGQPISQSVCPGNEVDLSVSASYPATYQWKFNGVNVASGGSGSTYVIASPAAGDAGNYTCLVTNPAGSVTSSAATLVVGSSITAQPASLSVYVSQTATFTVSVTGNGPFTYAWYKNAGLIGGATASTYTSPALVLGDNGAQFYATVTDACGTVLTSSPATLTVNAGNVPPTITVQPLGQLVTAETSASFSVTAVGTATLTYQWYRIPAGQQTGTAIAGATSPSYTLPTSATDTDKDQDQYYVIVSNAQGQAASQNATLAVDNGILVQITGQPQTVYVGAGAAATYSVTASSGLPSFLTYQWKRAEPGTSNFVVVPGATDATYTLDSASLSDTGAVYQCVVSNGLTTPVTSAGAGLFVGSLSPINDLCSSAPAWLLRGSAASLGGCTIQLTPGSTTQAGSIVWPTLIATGNLQLSFTVTVKNTSVTPADGFCLVLADPSLGATTSSLGLTGQGLGAKGIPGFVLGFDTYQNGSLPAPGDPPVPYLGVGRGETVLWENPWTNYNHNIPALAVHNSVVTHNYTVSLVQGQMTVTMDGAQVFSGLVRVPPVAYLMFTASTGGSYEEHDISNLSAILSAPSN